MSDITATLTETTITATVTNPADITATLTDSPITGTVVDGDSIAATLSETPIAATLVNGGTITATITQTPISVTVTQGIEEAPIDGETYGRKNGAWVVVTGGGGGGTWGSITGNLSDQLDLQAALDAKLSVETDPIFSASVAAGIDAGDISNWNSKLSVETDPVFLASVASAITLGDIAFWNAKQPALGYTPVDIASAAWIDLTDGGSTILHTHPVSSVVWGAITGTLSNQADLQAALDAKQNALGFSPVPNTRAINTTSPLLGGGDLSADRTLSIQVANGSQGGYLSSVDWTTFNNKQAALGYTPVNIASADWIDLTDGGSTALHTHAGSGAVWGAITGTLSNQTDLQTALNAKQNTLTFPLGSTLGGTGVNNAGTLTNASNTTITGGGTLALGGFTLTVPATGTVDLLGTAQTITAQKTFTTASGISTITSSDLGLAGVAPQHYGVVQIKRSTGVAAGVSIGYGTRGSADPGIEVYGSIQALNANGRLQIGTIGAAFPEIMFQGGTTNSIWIGAGNSTFMPDTTAGINLTSRLNFQMQTLITAVASGSIYSNGAFGSNSALGDIVLQSRYLSGQDKVVVAVHGTSLSDPDAYFSSRIAGVLIGKHTVDTVIQFPAATLHVMANTTTNNAVKEAARIQVLNSTSVTGGAAGFGVGLSWYAETATNTTNQQQGAINTSWIDATNASRKAKMSLSAYDTAARLGIEIEASGTVAKLGFYGVATVVRPTALTAQLTTITHTAPGANDYAIQDLVDSSGGAAFGFATKDEGNSVLKVVANLQTRVGELETKLQALGLLT